MRGCICSDYAEMDFADASSFFVQRLQNERLNLPTCSASIETVYHKAWGLMQARLPYSEGLHGMLLILVGMSQLTFLASAISSARQLS